MTTTSSGDKTVPDYFENSPSLSPETWMHLINRHPISDRNQIMFLQGLQEHPEWVNQMNLYQQTPLMIASFHGHTEIVQSLIRSGAEVNLHNGYKSALTLAVTGIYKETAKVLIDAGADINFQDDQGKTALIRSSCNGWVDVVQTLIELAADINLQDHEGWTALMFAVLKRNEDMVKLLMRSGADPDLQNEEGLTALMWAVSLRCTTIVKYFIQQGVDPLVLNQNHETAFDLARRHGYSELSCLLETYASQQSLRQVIQPLLPDLSTGSDSSEKLPSFSSSKHSRL